MGQRTVAHPCGQTCGQSCGRPGIAATAPIASRLTKLALQDGGHRDLESGLQWEAMAQPLTLATEDLQEGVRAAREKRAPRFTGR